MNKRGINFLTAFLFMASVGTVEAAPFSASAPKSRDLINAQLLLSKQPAKSGTCDAYSKQIIMDKASAYREMINEAARDHQVSPSLITAVMTVESCFRPQAESHMGAGGLMQLMPGTAERFGVKDRFKPADNIKAGVKYLRFLLDRYSGNIVMAAAAYNAGEGAVDKHNGIPPYQETQHYVRKVLSVYRKLSDSGNSQQVAKEQQRKAEQARLAAEKRHQQQTPKELDLTIKEWVQIEQLLEPEDKDAVLSLKQFL